MDSHALAVLAQVLAVMVWPEPISTVDISHQNLLSILTKESTVALHFQDVARPEPTSPPQ